MYFNGVFTLRELAAVFVSVSSEFSRLAPLVKVIAARL